MQIQAEKAAGKKNDFHHFANNHYGLGLQPLCGRKIFFKEGLTTEKALHPLLASLMSENACTQSMVLSNARSTDEGSYEKYTMPRIECYYRTAITTLSCVPTLI